eukprot:g7865.t1
MAESGKSQIQFADFISSVPGTVFHSTEVSRIETCTLVKEEPSDPSDVNETAVETAADEKFCGEETSISPGRIKVNFYGYTFGKNWEADNGRPLTFFFPKSYLFGNHLECSFSSDLLWDLPMWACTESSMGAVNVTATSAGDLCAKDGVVLSIRFQLEHFRTKDRWFLYTVEVNTSSQVTFASISGVVCRRTCHPRPHWQPSWSMIADWLDGQYESSGLKASDRSESEKSSDASEEEREPRLRWGQEGSRTAWLGSALASEKSSCNTIPYRDLWHTCVWGDPFSDWRG